jgi:hypothetical protein
LLIAPFILTFNLIHRRSLALVVVVVSVQKRKTKQKQKKKSNRAESMTLDRYDIYLSSKSSIVFLFSWLVRFLFFNWDVVAATARTPYHSLLIDCPF